MRAMASKMNPSATSIRMNKTTIATTVGGNRTSFKRGLLWTYLNSQCTRNHASSGEMASGDLDASISCPFKTF